MATPVTSVVIGEGGSSGALALASPRGTWCMPDSYLIIAPEAAAAILRRPPKDATAIADQLGSPQAIWSGQGTSGESSTTAHHRPRKRPPTRKTTRQPRRRPP
jgi:hypothetical protein